MKSKYILQKKGCSYKCSAIDSWGISSQVVVIFRKLNLITNNINHSLGVLLKTHCLVGERTKVIQAGLLLMLLLQSGYKGPSC